MRIPAHTHPPQGKSHFAGGNCAWLHETTTARADSAPGLLSTGRAGLKGLRQKRLLSETRFTLNNHTVDPQAGGTSVLIMAGCLPEMCKMWVFSPLLKLTHSFCVYQSRAWLFGPCQ